MEKKIEALNRILFNFLIDNPLDQQKPFCIISLYKTCLLRFWKNSASHQYFSQLSEFKLYLIIILIFRPTFLITFSIVFIIEQQNHGIQTQESQEIPKPLTERLRNYHSNNYSRHHAYTIKCELNFTRRFQSEEISERKIK